MSDSAAGRQGSNSLSDSAGCKCREAGTVWCRILNAHLASLCLRSLIVIGQGGQGGATGHFGGVSEGVRRSGRWFGLGYTLRGRPVSQLVQEGLWMRWHRRFVLGVLRGSFMG